ncbi:hypothetical protein [Streptomyces sp. NPDC007117]|uniref:hypothetical protein n=1 Tax=Streptomyces sp. NPDC007117 TaxID=3154314 RepID=UPI0033C4F1B0
MRPTDTPKVTGQLVHRCTHCHEFHTGHCEDAAIEREIRNVIDLRLAAALAAVRPRTSMAELPPALRGPRWRERR